MKLLYAIRHKPTGFFIPDPDRIQWRASHLQPVDCSGDGPNPRLFHTELSAKRALSAWLQGRWKAELEWESTDEYGSGFYYQSLPVPTPIPDRVKEDMEVVPIRLELV
ncbi:hypothetical protein [Caballeronia sp. LZ034LL]|uniref:hypothetical protein n=1 Tax=Caballeronia sp. LZ034LL TaxID=3038567 RepID=UPI00285C218C|nr:hypothetical protein [Caballeronia sp. LZ034LL]MDR5839369.1 hypothetical protein [Caballeronia sp. LZ034LL]